MSQNQSSTTSNYHRAKQWEIAFFSLNNSATNLYLFAFGFLTYYATGVAGFTTLLVSNLLGAARLFDGLIDPTIGVVMDRFNTRWGKFRPLMLISNIGLILSFLLLFSTHRFTGVTQTVLFLVALVFHKIVYSFQQTVTKAAQPALTNDPTQRPLFSIYDTVFSSIGVFALGQVIVSNFLAPRHGGEFNTAFFTEFLGGVMVISAVLTVLAIIGISRKDRTEYFGLGEETVETKSLKDYWSVIKGNTPLQVLALSGGIMKFNAQLIGDQAFLVILFGIILGNYGLSGRISLLQIIPNLLIVVLFTRLATKRDLKSSYTISVLVALASSAIMLAILFFSEDPTQIFTNGGLLSTLFIIGYIGLKVGNAYPTSIVLTMSADITDFETARSGRFVSGLIGTVFSLTDSIASSLAPIVIGFIVAGIGFTDGYPEATEQLTSNLLTGGLLMIGVPMVLYLVVLVLIRKYPLNREAMDKIQMDIAARKSHKA
ncbi:MULTISPECIES: MFS transporter [unclassified Jeotgalibaca]|uniref:MFS transporter n=1 Tax=unclassified Jeotgalibaca TaxID=2621505 RepID=UPI003FD38AFB